MNSHSSSEPMPVSNISIQFLSSLLMEERPITVDEACSGPCGVLAAVQAFVIYELIFGYSRIVLNNGCLRPTNAEKKEALSRALANILWQAGEEKRAIIAKKCDKVILDESITSSILKGDGIIEYVMLKHFKSHDSLLQHVYNFIQDVIDQGGCVFFLYSIILTHGIDKIKKEMDYPDSHLIGNDGYCSQELVNLILIGKAVPNVFNGDMELNSGGEEVSIHRGIPKQSRIGLLSSYEYQNAVSVGSYYKDPEYPIWVLLGDSHFRVLFGTSRDIVRNPDETFKLFYIDCLSSNNEEVSLTIKPKAKIAGEKSTEEKTLAVIIRCIYTRWPLAEIEVMNTMDNK